MLNRFSLSCGESTERIARGERGFHRSAPSPSLLVSKPPLQHPLPPITNPAAHRRRFNCVQFASLAPLAKGEARSDRAKRSKQTPFQVPLSRGEGTGERLKIPRTPLNISKVNKYIKAVENFLQNPTNRPTNLQTKNFSFIHLFIYLYINILYYLLFYSSCWSLLFSRSFLLVAVGR